MGSDISLALGVTPFPRNLFLFHDGSYSVINGKSTIVEVFVHCNPYI